MRSKSCLASMSNGDVLLQTILLSSFSVTMNENEITNLTHTEEINIHSNSNSNIHQPIKKAAMNHGIVIELIMMIVDIVVPP